MFSVSNEMDECQSSSLAASPIGCDDGGGGGDGLWRFMDVYRGGGVEVVVDVVVLDVVLVNVVVGVVDAVNRRSSCTICLATMNLNYVLSTSR